MQTIETKYHGPTDTRGSRISATASGRRERVWVSYDNALNAEGNHMAAALKLMEVLNWTGRYIGGRTPAGMVFVHAHSSYVIAR